MKQQIKSALAVSTSLGIVAGLVLLPTTVDAANTTTVNAVVSKVASVATTSGTVNLAINPTAAGSYTSASDTVTAGTNSATGYQLQISAATTALTNGGNTIVASSLTPATAGPLTVNKWGYRVDNGAGTFGAGTTSAQTDAASLTSTLWAGVTSSAVTIKSTSSANSADVTTVWYGASADFTKPNGTYTTSVTYTGLAN